jgi:putative redox protein
MGQCGPRTHHRGAHAVSVTREYIAAGKKRVNRIRARWLGGEAFEAGNPDRPSIRIDGKGKVGPGPVEVLLCALATCSAMDVVSILEKRRTPLASLDVEVHGDRADAIPARLTAIRMAFQLTGADVDRAHAERAIALSIGKYCSVRDSLDPALPIEWTLDLNGAPCGQGVISGMAAGDATSHG